MVIIGQLLIVFIQIYSVIVLARVLMSWVNIDPYSPLAQTLYNLTEPFLEPIRNLLPPTYGFDLSPMVGLITLQIVSTIIAALFIG
jgi:YggT family protein